MITRLRIDDSALVYTDLPLLVIEDDLILKKNAGETVQKLVKHIEETNPIPAQAS